jgi:hypothetical protein
MYFVVTFSRPFNSAHVRQFLESNFLTPVEVLGHNIAKVRLLRQDYPKLMQAIELHGSSFLNIRQITAQDKLSGSALDRIEQDPNALIRVNVQIFEPTEQKGRLREEIKNYVETRHLGTIDHVHSYDSMTIISGELVARGVKEIAENIDAISRVDLATLLDVEGSTATVELDSLPAASSLTSSIMNLPIVCVIDSGINRTHNDLQPYIEDVFDFTNSVNGQGDDVRGHGSKVAGIVIYAGNVTAKQPLCRIIAAKLFDNEVPDYVGLRCLTDVIQRFKDRTRVFNLSFSSRGPNPILSEAIDALALREGVMLVVSAGNVPLDVIMGELNSGASYPEYLKHFPVYPPGDCYNALTVGSYAELSSNLVPRKSPSPFTRTAPLKQTLKPEVLGSGGNLNKVESGGKVIRLDAQNLGVSSTSNNDSQLDTAVGTSFSCPAIASLASRLIAKIPDRFICLYKAIIVSSCERLKRPNKQDFESVIQGFGVPNEDLALNSYDWVATMISDSFFDLTKSDEQHVYNIPFPDPANRIRVVICFEVEPGLARNTEVPYEIRVKLHKRDTLSGSVTAPDVEIPGDRSNVKMYEYFVHRGGKAGWELILEPQIRRSSYLTRMSTKELRYGIVISVRSDDGFPLYDNVVQNQDLETIS